MFLLLLCFFKLLLQYNNRNRSHEKFDTEKVSTLVPEIFGLGLETSRSRDFSTLLFQTVSPFISSFLVSVWVSVSVPVFFGYPDGIGTGVEKIDTGKVSEPVSEKFGTEKSPRTGLVLIFGSLHTLMAT